MKALKINQSYERLSYLQSSDPDFGNISVVFEPRRNLNEEFQNIPVEELGHDLQVFLRVRPSLTEEDQETQVDISDGHSVELTAPANSNTFKNSVHGVAKLCHKFSFSHVFKPEATQNYVYDNTTKGLVADFISGQNCLLFAYGATNSGKTYTIQGTPGEPGILPKTFEQIFNSIGDHHYKHQDLKPCYFNGVCKLDSKEIHKEEAIKESLFKVNLELSSVLSQSTQSLSSALSKSGVTDSDLSSVITELSTVSAGDRNSNEYLGEPVYALFLSIAEIYNEIVYDLLDISSSKKNSRSHLNLGEDRNGATYIKGLREVRIRSVEEALRLLEVSRQNLHFAATKLNHNSSRSHCICTIKLLHLASNDDPHIARVSMLSLCDLAGAERATKTQGSLDRVKEASNINTSLLVLKRCIDALRRNHPSKGCKKKECPVPYRDSKLTRIFHSFFYGRGKAAMIVNIAKTPIIFDETLQVLKFSALAKQVQISQVREEESVVLPSRRPSQFSRLLRQSFNTSGRLSVPWANNSINNITFGGTKPGGQEDVMEAVEEEEDERYDELIDMIAKLKDELVNERKSKYEMEVKLRDELCNEFSQQIVAIENSWSERLRNEVAKTEELSDWRMNMLMRSIKKQNTRKRPRSDDDPEEEYVSSIYLFQEQVKVKERDDKIADQELQINQLDEELAVLKTTLKKTNEAYSKLQKESTANVFQLAQLTETLDKANKPLQTESQNSESRTDGLVISELQHQMNKAQASLKEKDKEVSEYKEMLMEAAEEFISKEQENAKLSEELQTSSKIIAKQALELNELQGQLEATRQHLSEVVQRTEELEEAAANSGSGPSPGQDSEKVNRLESLELQVLEMEEKLCSLEREKKKLEKNFKDSNSQVHQLQEEHLREKSKLLLEVAALKRGDGTFLLSPRKTATPIKVPSQEVPEMDLLKQEKTQLLEANDILKAQLFARKEEVESLKESHRNLLTEKEVLSNKLQETKDLFEHLRSVNAMTESLKEQALKENEDLEISVRELSEKLISIQESRASDLLDLSNLRLDSGQSTEKIESLKSQLEKKEEELERLQKEHERAVNEINELQKQVQEFEGQLKNLEDKKEEVVTLQEQVKELEGKLKSVKEELEGEKEIIDQMEEMKSEFESKKKEHQTHVEDMKETLDSLTKELEELKETLRIEQEENKEKEKISKEEIEKLVEENVKALENVSINKEEVVEEKARLEAELKGVSTEYKLLEARWQEEEETLRENHRKVIKDMEAANKALAENLKTLNGEVSGLAEKMEMSETKAEELKSDLLLAQSTLQQKEENNVKLQEELDHLKSEHENCKKTIADHKESMSVKLENLTIELDVLSKSGTREVAALKESHEKELKTLEEAHSTILEKAEARVKEMEVKVSSLEERLDEKLKKLEDVELELQQKLLQIKELKKQQAETQMTHAKVEELQKCTMEMEAKHSIVQECLEEMEQRYRVIENDREELQEEISGTQKQLNKLEEECSTKETIIISLTAKLENLDRKLSVAEEEVEEKKQMSTTMEELESTLENTKAKCQILQKENAALKEARQEEIGMLHAQAQEKEDLVMAKDQEITALQKEVKALLQQSAKMMAASSETKSVTRRHSTRSVKSEPEEHLTVINTLQEQVRHNESERLSLVSEVMDLRKQLDDAKLRMHELQEKTNASVITVPDTPTPTPTPVVTLHNSSSVKKSSRSRKKMPPMGTDEANLQSPTAANISRTPQGTTTQDSLHLCLEPSEGEESIAPMPKTSAKKSSSRPRRTTRNMSKILNDSFEYNIKQMAVSQEQENEDGDVWEPPGKPMKPPRNTRTKAKKKKNSVYNPYLENQENQRNVAIKKNLAVNESTDDKKQEGTRHKKRQLYNKDEDEIFLEVPNLINQQKLAEDSPHSLVRWQLRRKCK